MARTGRPKAIITLSDPCEVYDAFRDRFEKADHEEFLAVILDGRNRITGFNVVSVGSLTASLVHPREVFEPAILGNAAALILVHNHPSGDPEPSAEDKALTERLKAAGDLLGIKILDHIVIGDGRYFAFSEQQLLSSTRASPLWAGSFSTGAPSQGDGG